MMTDITPDMILSVFFIIISPAVFRSADPERCCSGTHACGAKPRDSAVDKLNSIAQENYLDMVK
ncbi:hypothetical protein A7T52_19500 [Salmonella enterica subsp. diarizonae serovar 60:r:e,n,x,z15]|nr:hypothetical protein A7T52_19500 [Salmonella enterica subsp. diarizonae serovar 60:r:e,n,x,z15]OHM89105.1 hypothetical protein A7T45_19505 [Salmonella enterica]